MTLHRLDSACQNAKPRHWGAVVSGCLGATCEAGPDNPWLRTKPLCAARGRFVPMEYAIANIPTLYRGRMYRSRLEAKWAAFFDRLGWTHEYEPFDLGSWSPDFLLPDFDMLVEVKPLTEFDNDVANKVLAATDPGQRVWITWVTPQRVEDTRWHNFGAFRGEHSTQSATGTKLWDALVPCWYRDDDAPRLRSDIGAISDAGFYSLRRRCVPKYAGWTYPTYVESLWSDATNAVQWEPGQ